jgi:calcium/calmodulin-dependent protein kinase I
MKCGTPGYVAPELLKGFTFGPKSDVFSLGCLFFNMATGKMLFQGRDTHETLFKNKYLDTTAIIEGTCQRLSRECRDLMKRMTAHNPENRLSTEECLGHPWFTQDAEKLQSLLELNRNQSE